VTQCYFKERWDMMGHVFHSFWMALFLSVWNADAMYDGCIEDMFYNAMVAYYLACANVALLYEKYGDRWDQHFLPELTFVNAMGIIGQFVGRCLLWPRGIAFLPSKTRERIAELWFAWIKERCRGMPREKDMIYGRGSQCHGKHELIGFSVIPLHSNASPNHLDKA
jgi:hypothetical protein